MDYKTLKDMDCSKHIEKKGKFNYISWPYMVDVLRTHEPKATIHARKNQQGMPYFKDESGALVETYILVEDVEVWNEWLPVMDFKNKSIKNPTSMDINKTIQRCKAKCISEYTGVGLYIYMGEDLPENGNSPKNTNPEPKKPGPKDPINPDHLSQFTTICEQNNLDQVKTAAKYDIRYKDNRMTVAEFNQSIAALKQDLGNGEIQFDLIKGEGE